MVLKFSPTGRGQLVKIFINLDHMVYMDKILHTYLFLHCPATGMQNGDTDANLTADPGVASSIPARSHTFGEIDHEIISTVILLPSAESLKKGCCQLQAKVCARSTG